VALTWVVLGVVLLAIELHHLAFYALFAAIAAFAAAIVALVAPDAVAAQLIVTIAATAAGILAVRPFISRAYDRHHPRGSHVARGVHGGLVGQEAFTIDDVGDSHRPGHVRLAGERWLAISLADDISPGTPVIVSAVRGTTLVVWPVDWVEGPEPSGLKGRPPREALGGAEEETT
jgi:membrane protein implicated in regulation of membrane protease activity